ncbi:MAG: DUF2849 domain-containing protein [Alphaproteobacteria bacterium]|nr:MAG: DUF2849 domain-containing protein [Alphaproteobacteria bacterium]
MSRRFTPSVISANDLMTGRPVWLAADDRWVDDIARAEILEDEAHAEIRLLTANADSERVVGPALAPVRPGPAGPEPMTPRERIRARGGPSIPLPGNVTSTARKANDVRP